jgi:hypothetical protein
MIMVIKSTNLYDLEAFDGLFPNLPTKHATTLAFELDKQ